MTTTVVLSPHLDDAILSLGGTMHLLGRAGISVRVVTLFAGAFSRVGPPSSWDAKRGHATAVEAFRARRAEDDRASAVLGVEPVWLPLLDASYLAPRDPDDVWTMVRPHLADADAVLVPGSPLAHLDHEYATALAVDRLGDEAPVFFYAEQPYSSRLRYMGGFLRGTTPANLQHLIGAPLIWTSISLDPASRVAKENAVSQYEGELAALGPRARMDAIVARLLCRETIGHRAGQPLPSFLTGAR